MEVIRGKQTSFIDTSMLTEKLIGYDSVHIDIGTGDGRFVRYIAQACPNYFVIGIDACRENLYDGSRRAQANTLFSIANAQEMPTELHGLAKRVTINFPWGSLLTGLLTQNSAVLKGLLTVTRPDAGLEIRINAGALAEAGWSFEEGTGRIRAVLAENGFEMLPPVALMAHDLKAFPTTWSKRLAFGRDPRAVYLRGKATNFDSVAPEKQV